MKKILLLELMMAACTGLNAQIMFKTEYFGESDYRMTEGDTDRKVGNSKGSAVVYQGGVNIPLSMKLDENKRPTMWALSIIRKTKRSEKIKRSVLPCKTKCSFFRFPLHNVKRLRFLWGVSCFLSSFSNIQVKLHTLITFKQLPCSL
ncbi:DUF6268 family outer membrane beta-barrel protein [Prevotella intermedia]|uniref:DUF6268 family outer membrane beta-barrel protein n=1 Tax=Prevotella intermedia TaxID=28131 RepID=UPI001E3E3556|nr:DUF6268 family outer membrane beta-barrel protein [Prevotella intermedia]